MLSVKLYWPHEPHLIYHGRFCIAVWPLFSRRDLAVKQDMSELSEDVKIYIILSDKCVEIVITIHKIKKNFFKLNNSFQNIRARTIHPQNFRTF